MMSSRGGSESFVLKAVTAITAGLLITGIGLFAHRKWTNTAKKFKVVFVLGGPGSGRGTVSSRVMKEFGYKHLSAGDLLREEREKNSEDSELINSYIREAKIVPSHVTLSILRKAMEKAFEEQSIEKFVIDGYPRDALNLEHWQKEMSGIAEIQFILFLDCPVDVMISRLLNRREGGRNDDMESIGKRIAVYEQSTRPLIDRFRAQGKIREVDASKSFESVFQEVQVHFSTHNAHFEHF